MCGASLTFWLLEKPNWDKWKAYVVGYNIYSGGTRVHTRVIYSGVYPGTYPSNIYGGYPDTSPSDIL